MAFISKFKSDTAYSNQDINEVISAITGQGVAPLSPNEILSNVAESGVTLSDERCAVVWADDEHTSVKISSGTVIMPDGSYIIISDEVLPVSSTELHYVYIYNDLILQNVPACETTLPSDGRDYVILAQVENGVIFDKRRLASSKIAGYGTNPYLVKSVPINIGKTTIPAGTPLFSLDIGTGYSRIIITSYKKTFISIYNLETELFEKTMFAHKDNFSINNTTISPISFGQLTISYVDGILSFHSSKDLYSYIPYDYTFDLIIF